VKKGHVPEGKRSFSPGVSSYTTISPTKARGISTNADASKGGERHIGVVHT